MLQQYTNRLIRLYPFEKGRNRILAFLKKHRLFRYFADHSTFLASLKTGQAVQVLGPEYMSDYIRLWGRFEGKTESFILAHLQSDCCFLDVGANFGYFSIVACSKSKNSRVLAIEPNPLVAQALRQSVELNTLHSKVTVLEMALSDETGWLPLICHDSNSGLSHIGNDRSNNDMAVKDATRVEVQVWDQWIETNHFEERTSIMKMDIEGAELKALRGMRNWLLKDRPAVVVEANDPNLRRFGGTRDEVEDFLLGLGYKHALQADNNFYMVYNR